MNTVLPTIAIPPLVAPTGHSAGRGAIVWLTGLSGAGKTTLAILVRKELEQLAIPVSLVDGDILRTGLSRDLGFSTEDRRENIRRATELALHLSEAGLIVIVALISPQRQDREAAAHRVRGAGIPFAEVFVNAPLVECERRDPKTLYKKARAGQIRQFTGVDLPYDPPFVPDLELRTDLEPVEQCVTKLFALVSRLARPMLQNAHTSTAARTAKTS